MPVKTKGTRGRPKGSGIAKSGAAKVRRPMLTETIIDVLKMKSIKDIDAAVDKVCERFEGKKNTKENTKMQIYTFISNIRNKRIAKYKNLKWDDENFLLTEG